MQVQDRSCCALEVENNQSVLERVMEGFQKKVCDRERCIKHITVLTCIPENYYDTQKTNEVEKRTLL